MLVDVRAGVADGIILFLGAVGEAVLDTVLVTGTVFFTLPTGTGFLVPMGVLAGLSLVVPVTGFFTGVAVFEATGASFLAPGVAFV